MSSQPEKFIQTSDYATLKNDASGTISITLTSGTVIAGGGTLTVDATATIGTTSASVRSYMVASNASTKFCIGTSLSFKCNITQLGYTYDYSPVANIERVSGSTVRLYCNIINFSPSDTLTISETVTVTATIRTFLSPFS